jgi:hypothetical protein
MAADINKGELLLRAECVPGRLEEGDHVQQAARLHNGIVVVHARGVFSAWRWAPGGAPEVVVDNLLAAAEAAAPLQEAAAAGGGGKQGEFRAFSACPQSDMIAIGFANRLLVLRFGPQAGVSVALRREFAMPQQLFHAVFAEQGHVLVCVQAEAVPERPKQVTRMVALWAVEGDLLRAVRTFPLPLDRKVALRRVAISPRGALMGLATESGVSVVPLRGEEKEVSRAVKLPALVDEVALTDDGTVVASTRGPTHLVGVFLPDKAEPHLLVPREGRLEFVARMSLTPDGRYCGVVTSEWVLHVFSLQPPELVARLNTQEQALVWFSFGPPVEASAAGEPRTYPVLGAHRAALKEWTLIVRGNAQPK